MFEIKTKVGIIKFYIKRDWFVIIFFLNVIFCNFIVKNWFVHTCMLLISTSSFFIFMLQFQKLYKLN